MEARMDGFQRHITEQIKSLEGTQLRIEKDVARRLTRIEKQTTLHNGRMKELEIKHIKEQVLREERKTIAAEDGMLRRANAERELDGKQDVYNLWVGLFPSLIAGTISGALLITFAAIFYQIERKHG